MALKELEQLTGELERLAEMLKHESNRPARIMILSRVQEIMKSIKEGAQ
jgi:hypothetical protein